MLTLHARLDRLARLDVQGDYRTVNATTDALRRDLQSHYGTADAARRVIVAYALPVLDIDLGDYDMSEDDERTHAAYSFVHEWLREIAWPSGNEPTWLPTY